jgi:hypothetical protein
MTPQPVQYTRLDLAEISENLQPYMRQMSEEWPLCVQADIGTETDVVEEVRKRDYIRREGTTIPLALAQLPFQCSPSPATATTRQRQHLICVNVARLLYPKYVAGSQAASISSEVSFKIST